MAGGALVGLILFALDFWVGGSGFFGMRDPRVIASVMERARAYAVGQQVLALAVMVAVCAIFGLIGSIITRRRLLGGVLGALILHSLFFLRSMTQFPQLYAAHFHGLLDFVAEHLASWMLDVAIALVLALFVWRLRRHWRLMVVLGSLIAISGGLSMMHRKKKGRAVVILAVDSLRPDRAFDARFPAMAGLVARGVRFDNAFVSQARTFPSMVSLLTGRLPTHHGIRHEFPTREAIARIGASLPEILGAAGWRTSVISDFSGEIFSRAPLGFQSIDVPKLDLFTIVGEQIVNGHIDLLPYASTRLGRALFPATGIMAELEDPMALAERAERELDRGGNLFLLVFFSAPHTPYAAPSPWWHRFADPSYRGPYRYLKEPLPQLAALPEGEARQVQALYDGAVGAVDEAIARIVARLDENSTILLLGDHGENLFEVPGRGMGHGDHLWGDLGNHIPLLIVDPHLQPHRVTELVREIDVAPTLAKLLAVPSPPGDGVDLFEARERVSFEETGLWLLPSGPGYRAQDRLPYPDLWHITEASADGEIHLQPRFEPQVIAAKVRALRTPKWKLVYQPTPSEIFWRLFDVENDPLERQDVAADHPEVVAELREKLSSFIDSAPAATPSPP